MAKAKALPRTRVFNDGEQRILMEALTSYIDSLDSFLADSAGDDVEPVRADRQTARELFDELRRDV